MKRCQRPQLKHGRLYGACIRQMYYKYLQRRVSEHQYTGIVQDVSSGLGLDSSDRALPNKTTTSRLCVEAGEWTRLYAARTLTRERLRCTGQLGIGCGRDGTGKNRFQFHLNSAHCAAKSGHRVSLPLG